MRGLKLLSILLAAVLCLSCEGASDEVDPDVPEPASDSTPPPADQGEESRSVDLGIPDRSWDPTRPDHSVGWCGEACIQMAMAYYGREVSQHTINEAGEPDHADLYVYDLADALNALGVSYVAWNESDPEVSNFIAWIEDQVGRGRPVLCGIKIYPDENPGWYLDHFVLVVGFNSEGLLVNTQLDLHGQQTISRSQLSSMNNGYSFESSHRHYFGISITGVAQ